MSAPEAWVIRVAINGVNSLLRRRIIERRALIRVAARRAEAPSSMDAELIELRQAVSRLPRRQRTVVVLRCYLDLSVDETATWMGSAPGTIKSLTHKALAALRRSPSVRDQERAR
jgi:RNA polymerase sigma factor (sigma-70 family)